jgi:hypothetical protein
MAVGMTLDRVYPRSPHTGTEAASSKTEKEYQCHNTKLQLIIYI